MRILQHFLRSTRFAFLRTSPTKNIQQMFVTRFAICFSQRKKKSYVNAFHREFRRMLTKFGREFWRDFTDHPENASKIQMPKILITWRKSWGGIRLESDMS